MRELLPTLIAANTAYCEPGSGASEAVDIELDFGMGDGARIIGIEFLHGQDGTTGEVMYGVSTDPNATAPSGYEALGADTDVIACDLVDITLTTSGGTVIQSKYMDLSNEVIVVTRNLRLVGYDAADNGNHGIARVHYNQVKFTEDELRSITIVNR